MKAARRSPLFHLQSRQVHAPIGCAAGESLLIGVTPPGITDLRGSVTHMFGQRHTTRAFKRETQLQCALTAVTESRKHFQLISQMLQFYERNNNNNKCNDNLTGMVEVKRAFPVWCLHLLSGRLRACQSRKTHNRDSFVKLAKCRNCATTPPFISFTQTTHPHVTYTLNVSVYG